MLKFGKGNAKLTKVIITFSLPSGWTCPGAKDCKSKVVIKNGKRKIKDGKFTKFRCFSASNEVLFPNIYNSRQYNKAELKKFRRSLPKTIKLIKDSLPDDTKYLRLHVAGDFYSQLYFDAWLYTAISNPNIVFYGYTKSLPYWIKRMNMVPSNLVLTASLGGRYDHLIEPNNLRYAKVVFSEEEAANLNLEIDHDDSHAIKHGASFALLIHGVQPKGSEAAKAKSALKGKGSYSRKKLKTLTPGGSL